MQAFTAAAEYLGGKYLKDCTLYVTLEPCIMCLGAAYWTQIERIVYGTADKKHLQPFDKKMLLHPKTKITGGVLEAECAKLLSDFFAGKRK
jgi:tRNA(adenine34) deaminase